jgi:hypothetical protein
MSLEQKLFRMKLVAPKNKKKMILMPEVLLLPPQFPRPKQTLLEDMQLEQKLFRTKFVAPKKQNMTCNDARITIATLTVSNA